MTLPAEPLSRTGTSEPAVVNGQVARVRPRLALLPREPQRALTETETDSDPQVRKFPRRIFLAVVGLPTLIAILYFGFIASDIYTSEASFVVRSSAGGNEGAFAALVSAPGMSRSMSETYAVAEYMGSRSAMDELSEKADLRAAMAREEGDFVNRYPNFFTSQNDESRYRAFEKIVRVDIDESTGISTLTVNAFRAKDAQKIAQILLQVSESFINKLNIRAQENNISFAQSFVSEAQRRFVAVEAQLAAYRNSEIVFNPAAESKSTLTQLSQLATEIAKLEASLAQQRALAPNSPTIAPIMERITSYRAQMAKIQSTIAGDQDSLATKLQQFEVLSLEKELAGKWLASATQGLEKARQEAFNQRIYLQIISAPNLSDYASKPYRLLGIAAVAGLAFLCFAIVRALYQSVLEHRG